MSDQISNPDLCVASGHDAEDSDLNALVEKLTRARNNAYVLERYCRSFCGSLRQIMFFSSNNGTIGYGKVMEIMEKNGTLNLQRPLENTD